MAKYTKESIQRLREQVDIAEIISRSVPLKKMGAVMRGLCPFHDEKSPSFYVYPATRHYHCFGCAAHGDAVSFLMQTEGMSFTHALKFLSERFQIALQEEKSGLSEEARRDEKKRARCLSVLEAATNFFHLALLYSNEAESARKYLLRRQINHRFVRDFALGFCPEVSSQGSSLQEWLRYKEFSLEEMIAAGVVASSKHDGGRAYDFFSGRIVFPIYDQMGLPIGFSARKIDERTGGGKYINTPETILFKKSRVFFGLSFSKKRIIKERIAVLVEGQLDALRLVHEGFDITIATLGTALAAGHVETLKALGVETVYISFDADQAGVQSAMKAADLLIRGGIQVRHVLLRGAKDPDEFVLKYGRSEFLRALVDAVEHIDFCLEEAKSRVNWSLAGEREKTLRQIVARVQDWQNPLLSHEACQQLSKATGVPLHVLIGETVHVKKKPMELPALTAVHDLQQCVRGVGHAEENGALITIDAATELELDLIRWLISLSGRKEQLVRTSIGHLVVEDFTTDIGKRLYEALFHLVQSPEESVSLVDLASELSCTDKEDAYLQYMVKKPPLREEKAAYYVREALQKLKERRWFFAREEVRQKILEQSEGLSEEEQMKYLSEFSSMKPPVIPPLDI